MCRTGEAVLHDKTTSQTLRHQVVLGETKFKVSIEAATTNCWKKYIGDDGITFGINTFGKSAPYKDIYKYFGLTAVNISNKCKKLMRN